MASVGAGESVGTSPSAHEELSAPETLGLSIAFPGDARLLVQVICFGLLEEICSGASTVINFLDRRPVWKKRDRLGLLG